MPIVAEKVVDDTLSTCFWMTPWSIMFDGPLLNGSDSNIIATRVIYGTASVKIVNEIKHVLQTMSALTTH